MSGPAHCPDDSQSFNGGPGQNLDDYVQRIVERAGTLTSEDAALLRDLLPPVPPADRGPAQSHYGSHTAWAAEQAAKLPPMSDEQVAVAGRLAAEIDQKAAERKEHIKRLVDAAPPLTDEQREKLALLLHPGGER